MSNIRFDSQVVVITGAGNGLGKACALFFSSRGAKVVVNDSARQLVDAVVAQILADGGHALASYESVENGEKIIEAAASVFGRIDILINNAAIHPHTNFEKVTDYEWDSTIDINVKGVYRCTHAAWVYFRKQKYGRVITVSSPEGIYGAAGQTAYAAASFAMVGFTETIAKEGAKYNILSNVIVPRSGNRSPKLGLITERGTPERMAVPLVAFLSHQSNTKESGSIIEVDTGRISKLRWERSRGATLKCDETFTPGAVLQRWEDVNDFRTPDYPVTTADMVTKLNESSSMASNHPGENIRFDGKVVVVTGGGAGLGRAYCLQFAKHGAFVVVNDLVNPDTVVNEIRSFGGVAVGNRSSVENGAAIIETAINTFNRIDILINNAGILRDKAFVNMTEKQWDDIMNVHLRGTYACTKAAYPYMLKQKYGRIINTASTSGIYGNYGQANYAAAKLAILGFSRALAVEGRPHNIYVNTIAPSAGTQLTQTVLPPEAVHARRPDYVAPPVLLLCSDRVPESPTGHLFEVGCGWIGRTRWQRSGGYESTPGIKVTPENVLDHWPLATDFTDGRADSPETPEDGWEGVSFIPKKQSSNYLAAIERAKAAQGPETRSSYNEHDVTLYNLSLGARATDLPLVYEQSDSFHVLPTFGVIPAANSAKSFDFFDILPNFSFKMLLHGEQYLEIRKFPIPRAAEVISIPRLIEVVDKGKASVVVNGVTTVDAKTREELFYNESTLFIRGSGGFGGLTKGTDRARATATYVVPKRNPDITVEERTSLDQAALYRLNGDLNPLHIDPQVSRAAGFQAPILHGLCSFGLSGKHLLENVGDFKNIKARFTGIVLPGQTLITEMWNEHTTVVFQTRVKETGKLCMSNGGAELLSTRNTKL